MMAVARERDGKYADMGLAWLPRRTDDQSQNFPIGNLQRPGSLPGVDEQIMCRPGRCWLLEALMEGPVPGPQPCHEALRCSKMSHDERDYLMQRRSGRLVADEEWCSCQIASAALGASLSWSLTASG
jgi:hypothetical protein